MDDSIGMSRLAEAVGCVDKGNARGARRGLVAGGVPDIDGRDEAETFGGDADGFRLAKSRIPRAQMGVREGAEPRHAEHHFNVAFLAVADNRDLMAAGSECAEQLGHTVVRRGVIRAKHLDLRVAQIFRE